MTDTTPLGSAQHHASNALGYAGIAVLIAFNVLGFAVGILPSWPAIILCLVGTAAFSFINFRNTLEENSAWKSYGAMIMILIVAALYAYPIGVIAINQP